MEVNSKNWIDEATPQLLKHKGTNQTPSLVVVHYSVTKTVAGAVKALNKRKLSYHLFIAKDGTLFQTRRLTETAAHPGRSNWKRQSNIKDTSTHQRGSIGICFMNMGFAIPAGNPASQTHVGKLKYFPTDPSMQRWDKYTDEQLHTCQEVIEAIGEKFTITEIVGHHDIAIGGKFDPGPQYDFDEANDLAQASPGMGFKTNVKLKKPGDTLSIRQEPNRKSKKLGALNLGDELHVRSIAYGPPKKSISGGTNKKKRWLTVWASVDVDESNTHAGFVHMGGLASTPLIPMLQAKLPKL
ncbi:MAG: N-acetylmuramoyl-L-alanine amidase [Hyphomicrobiales bacterium]|nr:N-acetylmuramoyl-L-alanine amidase [Hyphomicrobiales bacterium]